MFDPKSFSMRWCAAMPSRPLAPPRVAASTSCCGNTCLTRAPVAAHPRNQPISSRERARHPAAATRLVIC